MKGHKRLPAYCPTILIWGTQSQRSTDTYDLYDITILHIGMEDPKLQETSVNE